jgi:hypothetical protein
VFLLSFFPWHVGVVVLGDVEPPAEQAAKAEPRLPAVGLKGSVPPLSLWQLAFTSRGSGLFLAYTLLTLFLAWPLSIVGLLLDRRLVPVPPALRPLLPWKTLLLVSIVAAAAIPLLFDSIDQHFYEPVNHIAIAMKLGARLHIVALIVGLLEFWLQDRQRRALPPPRIEVHW